MTEIISMLFNVGIAEDSASAGLLKPGLPANDFWASLAMSLLVLAALIHAGVYLHYLTRKKN